MNFQIEMKVLVRLECRPAACRSYWESPSCVWECHRAASHFVRSYSTMNMNRYRSRCVVLLVAFTTISSFMVMNGSLDDVLGVPGTSSLKGSSKTSKKQSRKKSQRKHRLFRRYMEDKCDGKENILNILQQNIDTERCHVATLITQQRLETTTRIRQERHVYGMTTCRLEDLCQQLPQWKQIKNSYGSLPTFIGANSCSPKQSTGELSAIHVTSLFANAGGDLLETTLRMNYPHLPIQKLAAAMKQHSVQQEDVLRVVVVRDPFRWMAAMVRLVGAIGLDFSSAFRKCKSNEGVSWIQAPNHHCPNLVPSGDDTNLAKRLKTYVVTTPSGHRHRSLSDLWTTFYSPYFNEDFVQSNRILVVRYEDILFHVESVLDSVLACVGDVTTQTKTAKLPFRAVGEMAWLQKRARYAGMTNNDLVYAKKTIPSWMLQKLQYPPIPKLF